MARAVRWRRSSYQTFSFQQNTIIQIDLLGATTTADFADVQVDLTIEQSYYPMPFAASGRTIS